VVPTGKRRFTKKRTLLLAAIPIVVVAGWYGIGRLVAPLHAVRVVSAHTGPPPASDRPATETLRVLIYNIAHGRGTAASNWEGGDRETRLERLDAIADLLRRENADVAVLNEVDFDATWSYGVNQAEYLAREAGYPYRSEQRNYDVSLPFRRYCGGNAVLSRFPIPEARLVEYPALSRTEMLLAGGNKGLLCTVRIPPVANGTQPGTPVSSASLVASAQGLVSEFEFTLLAVHLEHRSEATRILSAEHILNLARDSSVPMILAGDFNSSPAGFPGAQPDAGGRTALGLLINSGRFHTIPDGPPAPSELTFPSWKPDRLIDWILVPPDWDIEFRRVIDSPLSDHCPVVVEIRIPRSASP